MQKVTSASCRILESERYSIRFKIRHYKIVRIINTMERYIQKIGDVLIFFNLDGIHHIVNPNRHVFERYIVLFIRNPKFKILDSFFK